MTREEAIRWLKLLKGVAFPSQKEAVDMAVEALSVDSDCNNCKEYGSYKCTRCDGEIYFKADDDLISRQEAINHVCHECECIIRSLPPQEQTQEKRTETNGVCSDLISRADAIDEALTFFIEYLGGAFDEESQRLLAQRMNSLPSVDITETEICQKCQEATERVLANAKAKAEPRHGEWVKWIETIEDDTGVSLIPHWKCSICNTEYDPYFANRINFCPNCGAKMDGGK